MLLRGHAILIVTDPIHQIGSLWVARDDSRLPRLATGIGLFLVDKRQVTRLSNPSMASDALLVEYWADITIKIYYFLSRGAISEGCYSEQQRNERKTYP